MQINGSFQIVTVVTSVVPAFFGCIALLFFHFVFRFLVLLYLLECAGEFRLCGGDHGLCPLDSHKPLKRLDRNFKCFCAVTFVSLIGFCAMLTTAAACRPSIYCKLNAAALIKIKIKIQAKLCVIRINLLHYPFFYDKIYLSLLKGLIFYEQRDPQC